MLQKSIILFILTFALYHSNYAQQEECPQFEWVEGMTVKPNNMNALSFFDKQISITDNDGNVYISFLVSRGNSFSIPDTLFIGNNNIPIIYPNDNRIGLLIIKLDVNHNVIWHQFAHSSNVNSHSNLYLNNMQLDSRGNAYITGNFINFNTTASDTFAVANKYIIGNSKPGNPNYYKGDGFLFKLNGKTGDPFWIKKFTGIVPTDFKISNTDRLYFMMGAGYDTVYIDNQQFTNRTYQSCITQFNALGELQWITWGEQNSQIAQSSTNTLSANYLLTADNNDNAYTFFLNDSTISKIDATGQVVWNRSYKYIRNVGATAIHVNPTSNMLYVTMFGPMNAPELKVDFGNGDTLNTSEYGSSVLWGLETNGGQTAFASVLWDNPSDSTKILITNLKSDNMGYVYLAAHIHTRNGDTSYIGDSAIVVTLSDKNFFYGSADAFIAKVLPPAEGIGKLDHIWSLRTSGPRPEVIYLSKVEDSGTEMYFFNNTNGGAIGSGDAVLGQYRFTGDSSHNYFGKINTDCSLPTEEITNPLQSVTIYPNPAHTNITINNLPPNSSIHLTDISGRVLYTQYNKTNSTAQIPVNSMGSGMYFVQIINGESMVNTLNL